MNTWPMILRFCSGSVTPASASRNRSRGVDDAQVEPGSGRGTCARPARASPCAQQAVVDEDAGQPRRRSRAEQQRRRDRRVDAARQAADRRGRRRRPARGSRATASSTNAGHRPVAGCSRRCRTGSCARISPPRGVCADLGVELHAVDRRASVARPPRTAQLSAARRAARSPAAAPRRGRRGSSRPAISSPAAKPWNRSPSARRRVDRRRGRTRAARAGSTLPPSSCAVSCRP